jgi:hypothetical protein
LVRNSSTSLLVRIKASSWRHAPDAPDNYNSVYEWSFDLEEFKHQKLTYRIIGVFYEVYNELVHGFLESVYQKSLRLALQAAGFKVRWPIDIPAWV